MNQVMTILGLGLCIFVLVVFLLLRHYERRRAERAEFARRLREEEDEREIETRAWRRAHARALAAEVPGDAWEWEPAERVRQRAPML